MNGRGKNVVGALPKVDVVVRMDGPVPFIPCRQFIGPMGDHFVGVHVAGRAGTRLKDVDGKMAVELSVGHLAARRQQGVNRNQ